MSDPGSRPEQTEETLDPQSWGELRQLSHRMLDDMLDDLQSIRSRRVWQPVPEAVKASLREPLPRAPQGLERTYAEFRERVRPYPLGNDHPRFWGWVIGTGTVTGMLADMLAAGINTGVAGADEAGRYVERQVLDWFKEILSFPPHASGLLVSGTSIANLVALAVARNAHAGCNVRSAGMLAVPAQLVVYGSCETHSSVHKALELLGLGREAFRSLPVGSDYRVDIAALEQAIETDRACGLRPVCIVANAGTVNTGAIDDLQRVADIRDRHDLWLHVDGAFGALAALSPALKPLLAGMERADSVAFDLHKWMYLPFDVGCVLVRDARRHRDTFSLTADYLTHGGGRGIAGTSDWFSDYGVQLSRSFRALKVWMSLKEHGFDKHGRIIRQNVEQARYLADRVDATPPLERLAPVSLNIVCFRYRVAGIDDAGLNRLNEEILLRLHESGVAVPSYTMLEGRYAIRVCVANHRSRREDFDRLLEEIVRSGAELTS